MKILALLSLSLLVSCQHSLPQYLVDQGLQQGSLYMRAQPIDSLLQDPTLPSSLKQNLSLSQSVLAYAETDLSMQTHGNYRSYVDVKGPAVSYAVIAAYADKLEAYKFEYPFFGKLPYRAYFKKADALDYARYLEQTKGLDTNVRPVPAYSTTGYLKDPLVSSITSDNAELIEILLHELVHLQFFFKDESDFNEAFATWFSRKEALSFVEKTPTLGVHKEDLLKRFADSEKRYQKLQVTLKRIQSYFDASTPRSPEEKEKFYTDLQKDLSQDPDLKGLGSRKWNHAISTSFGTYLSLLPKIEAYAQKNHLQPKAFLELLKSEQGPAIARAVSQNN